MRIIYQTFALPKIGRTLEDYEDAYFPVDQGSSATTISSNRFRCALADGATEAVFSKYWADLLVQQYGQIPSHEISESWLARARSDWELFVSTQELPWYAEEKIKAGAFSTLLGLTVLENNKWVATAIGDSCLFQLRNNELLKAMPLASSAEFDTFPVLLGSRQDSERAISGSTTVKGDWQAGDAFFLMSDALAGWFLRSSELGLADKSIAGLLTIVDLASFQGFVDAQRQFKDADVANLKDDDVTLIRVRLETALPTSGPDLKLIRFTPGQASTKTPVPRPVASPAPESPLQSKSPNLAIANSRNPPPQPKQSPAESSLQSRGSDLAIASSRNPAPKPEQNPHSARQRQLIENRAPTRKWLLPALISSGVAGSIGLFVAMQPFIYSQTHAVVPHSATDTTAAASKEQQAKEQTVAHAQLAQKAGNGEPIRKPAKKRVLYFQNHKWKR